VQLILGGSVTHRYTGTYVLVSVKATIKSERAQMHLPARYLQAGEPAIVSASWKNSETLGPVLSVKPKHRVGQ
jgi:hypothetical protein